MNKYLTSFLMVCFLLISNSVFAYGPETANENGAVVASGISRALKHPISLIEADVYVTQKKTNMRLKMFAEDLEFFQGVEADEVTGKYDHDELKQATKDHGKYLAEKISVRNELGELIEVEIAEVIDFDIPDEGINSGELMSFQIGYVFEYKHEKPPSFLTFQQDVVDEDFLFPAEMKILLKQSGTDNSYMAMLKAGQPETVPFDWDKPPLNSTASEKEWEEWFDEQREKNLGITSYSSVYSFIYITDHEVRHEVLIPLASLATMVDFERVDNSFLEIAEQPKAAEAIEKYFADINPVHIDSVRVAPVFDRIDFYGLDIRDFAMQAEKRKVSMANGRAGLIMSYKTKGTPETVEVTWDKFSSAITTVEAVSIAFDKIENTQFSTYVEENTYTWKNPGLPPISEIDPIEFIPPQPTRFYLSLVSIVCASVIGLIVVSRLFVASGFLPSMVLGFVAFGIGIYSIPHTQISFELDKATIPDQTAQNIFKRLHKNLFRAFDYYDEEDSYDALERSVHGPQLRQTYLDVRKSLEIKEQGGAVSNIEEVNFLEGDVVEVSQQKPLEQTGFRYKCKWNLVGTIEHWGHIHQRTNTYEALFNVENRDGQWKITYMDVIDQEPGIVKTEPRKR